MRPIRGLFVSMAIMMFAVLSGCAAPSIRNLDETMHGGRKATIIDTGIEDIAGGPRCVVVAITEADGTLASASAPGCAPGTFQTVMGTLPAAVAGSWILGHHQLQAAKAGAQGARDAAQITSEGRAQSARIRAEGGIRQQEVANAGRVNAATINAGGRRDAATIGAGATRDAAAIGAGATRDAAGTTAAAMRYQGDQGLAGQQARAAATDRATTAGQAQFAETRGAQVAAQQAEAATNNPINAGNPMSNLNPINVLRNAFRF